MTKTEILQKDALMLRETARLVSVKNIGTKKIQDLLERMKEALHAEEDGVALAAPQIGESLRIFIVNGEMLVSKQAKKTDLVFINPELIKTSKKKKRVEEGCLSLRYLYGQLKRSEKVTIKAYDETGKTVVRGASGLLAQIFQHEIDHLNGILFTDTAENVRDIPPARKPTFVFFGSSQFSRYVLEELELAGFSPLLSITSARDALPTEELRKTGADVFVVASFGKILPKELIELPRYKTLNVHPSLLPQLRGPAPIQDTILGKGVPGVTIIRMDEKMDHGFVITQEEEGIDDQDDFITLSERLEKRGADLLIKMIPDFITGKIKPKRQNDTQASYCKLIKKEDGKIDFKKDALKVLRQIRAFIHWPGSFAIWKEKNKMVKIIEAQLQSQLPELPFTAGMVFKTSSGKPAVVCGKKAIIIETIQIEGKKPTDSISFLNGYPDFIGANLS